MNSDRYNPFNKELEKVDGKNLAILRDISEGWFVDYKSQTIKIKDYAKHISAFANQYGGWLFVGIKEDEKLKTASAFTGIPNNKIASILQQLREANSAHIQPSLFFETKVIQGAVKEIGLPKNSSIIIVNIPQGQNSPYIHSSGKIYQRINDESKPTTERHAINLLWDRSEKLQQNFEKYIKKEYFLYDNEKPRAYFYLISDPHINDIKKALNFEDFLQVMQGKVEKGQAFIKYDNVYSSQDGYIARQIANNDPNTDVLTFRWNQHGDAFVELPLNLYNQNDAKINLISYNLSTKYLQLLENQRFRNASIIDYSYWMAILATAASQFLILRKKAGITGKAYIKAKLSNIGGTTAFINSARFIKEIEQYGAPIVRDKVIWYPTGFTTDSLFELNINDKDDMFVKTGVFGFTILNSVGVIRNIFDSNSISDIYEATRLLAQNK